MEKTIKYSDIIQNQPTINIGTAGHVAHGKSQTVFSITKIRTQKYSKELEKNVTIKLGYANAKIFQCPETGYITSVQSSVNEAFHPITNKPLKLVKHVSFVDVPGHEAFMATMIGGTNVMDATIMIIAGNEKVPQPQTEEHLLALHYSDITNFLILHNKLDLTSKEQCLESYEQVKEFIKDTPLENSNIIPVSAQFKQNINFVLEYITFNVHDEIRSYNCPARMMIIRTFDVNHAGYSPSDVIGGVVGGSLLRGIFTLNDIVEIRPGIIVNNSGRYVCIPLITTINSLFSETQQLEFAIPGGLIGVGLNIDPGLTRSDHLVGHMIGHIGTLPDIYTHLKIKYRVIQRRVILRTDDTEKVKLKSVKFKEGEQILLSINSMTLFGLVTDVYEHKKIKIRLDIPLCVEHTDKIVILRQIDKKWRLEGKGKLIEGFSELDIIYPNDYDKLRDSFKIPKYNIINDVNSYDQKQFSYEELLNNISFKKMNDIKTSFVPPQVKYINKVSIFHNFSDCVRSMAFSPEEEIISMIDRFNHIYEFIKNELCTEINVNADKHLIIKNRYNSKNLQKVLQRYVKSYIVCPNCNKVNSYLFKKERLIFRHCNNCLSETCVG